jgi:hypothetical protein
MIIYLTQSSHIQAFLKMAIDNSKKKHSIMIISRINISSLNFHKLTLKEYQRNIIYHEIQETDDTP